MRAVSVVVVDLPFVPVIAITRPVSHREASSTSPMTGTPALRAAVIASWSGGTPGLSTTRSALANSSGRCGPTSTAIPAARRAVRPVDSLVSFSVTLAPRARSNSAAAIPLRPPPATTTCLPLTLKLMSRSPQLQRRQAEEREDDRENQEPRDDLRLRPSDELEV